MSSGPDTAGAPRIDLVGPPAVGKSTLAAWLIDQRLAVAPPKPSPDADDDPFVRWCEWLIEAHGDLYNPWMQRHVPKLARTVAALEGLPADDAVVFDESPTQRALSIDVRHGRRLARRYARDVLPVPWAVVEVVADHELVVSRLDAPGRPKMQIHRGLDHDERVAQTRRSARWAARVTRSLGRRGSRVVRVEGDRPVAEIGAQVRDQLGLDQRAHASG
jgi:hypothetical protein